MLAKLGMADKVKGILEEAGLDVVIFDGAQPNPTDLNVEAAFEVWKENSCDAIVSLGGGSSHDCAKGLGLIAANGGNIRDYEGLDKSTKIFHLLLQLILLQVLDQR